MKAFSADTIAALGQETTPRCWVWRLQRVDGVTLRLTDHDRNLTIDGEAYACGAALSVDAHRVLLGTARADLSTLGAFTAEGITEADLRAGLWDHATLDVFDVDWATQQHRVHVLSGRIGRVTLTGGRFEADIEEWSTVLHRPGGRLYLRSCDAILGDARCGVSLGAASWTFPSCTIVAVDGQQVRINISAAVEDGWFTHGKLHAANASWPIRRHRRIESLHLLDLPTASHSLSVGDSVTLLAGCDKRANTCRTKFANIERFRGFPHLLSSESLITGPAADEPLDGGSRWRR